MGGVLILVFGCGLLRLAFYLLACSRGLEIESLAWWKWYGGCSETRVEQLYATRIWEQINSKSGFAIQATSQSERTKRSLRDESGLEGLHLLVLSDYIFLRLVLLELVVDWF